MSAVPALPPVVPVSTWHELVLPREHGSWAFAFEPVALGAGIALVRAGFAPPAAGWLLAILAGRAVFLLVVPRPGLRARRLGMFEAGLGVAFVLTLAATWLR